MTLTLTHTAYTPNGVFGVLTSEGGLKLADTLEHAYNEQNSLPDQPKLPLGEYTCLRGMHSLHSHPETFSAYEVTGVPGHTGILFHIGNYNNDSDGCILLGQYLDNTMIIHSKQTFDAFMTVMQNIPEFTLLVINQGDI